MPALPTIQTSAGPPLQTPLRPSPKGSGLVQHQPSGVQAPPSAGEAPARQAPSVRVSAVVSLAASLESRRAPPESARASADTSTEASAAASFRSPPQATQRGAASAKRA